MRIEIPAGRRPPLSDSYLYTLIGVILGYIGLKFGFILGFISSFASWKKAPHHGGAERMPDHPHSASPSSVLVRRSQLRCGVSGHRFRTGAPTLATTLLVVVGSRVKRRGPVIEDSGRTTVGSIPFPTHHP